MAELYGFAKDFGFPAFVALFVLFRVERRLEAVERAIWILRGTILFQGGSYPGSSLPHDRPL